MTELERLIRVHRVRDRMLVEGRVYTPLANETFDMIADSMGIRFSTTIFSVFYETAIVRQIDRMNGDYDCYGDISENERWSENDS